MLPAPDGFLVGESRNEELKTVEFFCVDLASGRPVWEKKKLDEDWWIGIEAVHGGFLFLHRFARPDMPEHAGIVALDRSSGSIVWEQPYVQLVGAQHDRLYVRDHRTPEAPPSVVEIRSGDITEETVVMSAPEAAASYGFGDSDGITFPAPLQPGEEGWAFVQKLLRGRTLVGACEAVSVDDRWIFCYHATDRAEGASKTFEHLIAVVDDHGKILFDDILHKEAHMPVYDAFFVHNSSVCFIRQERTLVSVDLRSA